MEVGSIGHPSTAESGNQYKSIFSHRIFTCITKTSNDSPTASSENFYENIDEDRNTYKGKSHQPFDDKTNSTKTITRRGMNYLSNIMHEIGNLVRPAQNNLNKNSASTFFIELNEYGETGKNGSFTAANPGSQPASPQGAVENDISLDEYATPIDALDQPIYAELIELDENNEEYYEEIIFNNNGGLQNTNDVTSMLNQKSDYKSDVIVEKEPIESFLYPKDLTHKTPNKPSYDLKGSFESFIDVESVLRQKNVKSTVL